MTTFKKFHISFTVHHRDRLVHEKILGNKTTGIRWTMDKILEDLDFADGICLLTSDRNNMQKNTVENELRSLGMTWGEAERKAQDRQQWRALVLASCASIQED